MNRNAEDDGKGKHTPQRFLAICKLEVVEDDITVFLPQLLTAHIVYGKSLLAPLDSSQIYFNIRAIDLNRLMNLRDRTPLSFLHKLINDSQLPEMKRKIQAHHTYNETPESSDEQSHFRK